jgi:uncharacterized protein (TIGR02646 family)
MIHIERSTVDEPPTLRKVRDSGFKHAQRFFSRPSKDRRQERYFNPYWAKAYRIPIPALGKLFHQKCAFCESKVNLDSNGIVDHLRPKWATRGLSSKDYAPDHYWWLAYTWSNLYLACPACNKHRGQRFPVKGKRIAGPDEDAALEQPLLLDPCHDTPEAHLHFDTSGTVKALTHRGSVTISLVSLNRPQLVNRRRLLGHEVVALTKSVRAKKEHSQERLIKMFSSYVAPGAEYSCFATQLLRRHLPKNLQAKIHGLKLDMPESKRKLHATTAPTPSIQMPRYVDEIDLVNIRGIKNLSIKIPTTDQSNMDWLMMIGENAVGKTSILQASALNLMSDTDRHKLRLNPRNFVRRGAKSAQVKVRFRGGGDLRNLTIHPKLGFRCSDPKAGAPLMAYGATRLPPLKGMHPTHRVSHFSNLFNPFAPLADAVHWLKTLKRADFDYAASALKALLAIDQEVRFRRTRTDVFIDLYKSPITLTQLSDGYQSVIALAADLMASIHHSFQGGMEAAEGIVLLDEIGAHLHPRWKMRISKALRQTFPRLQFLVTTHDPLCLRGLRNGEVVTLQRTHRGQVFIRKDLPPIEGMRVDQILQSEYFGLRSSMDPDIEADFDKMYRLKAKPTLTNPQRNSLAQLEARLANFEVLGSTRSERLMLSEINRYLAVEREQPDQVKRDQDWEYTKKRISKRLEKELGIVL